MTASVSHRIDPAAAKAADHSVAVNHKTAAHAPQHAHPGVVWRSCATCDSDDLIRRKPVTAGATHPPIAPAAAPKDFAHIRVHAEEHAEAPAHLASRARRPAPPGG